MRGESLRRGAEGSYETGVQCLYLSLDDTPSLPAGSHPWGWECRARRRRRSRRGQRSAGARCTRPPPPPVPLCHEPASTPGTELCGRSVPRWFAGPWQPGVPRLLFPSAAQGQQELGTHGLISGAASGGSGRGSQGLESPLQCHLPNVFVRMGASPAASRGALLPESCLCLQGSRFTPDLWRLLHGRKAPIVDTEEALKVWAGTRHLRSSHPPPPLRSRYLSKGKSL